MQINVGFEMIFDCPKPTPMIFNLNVHYSRVSDLVGRDALVIDPPAPMGGYRDPFGNWCTRIVAPKGRTRVTSDAVVNDTGLPDVIVPEAQQIPVEDLPEDTLIYLLGSRYCDTDRLSATAWNLFGQTPEGWDRVQAICDYVHRHITFDYQLADNTRTALDAFNGRVGVCRDFTHLAVAFCRCMNIPTRYCTGYLGDIGIPPPYGPMDFLRLVRGVPRRAVAHLRRSQQHTADRPGADRPWPRRRRRRAQQCVRPRGPDELQGMDRRGARREQLGAAHTVADGRLTDEFGCPTTGSTIPLTHACRGVASVAGSAVCKTHRKPPPRRYPPLRSSGRPTGGSRSND